MAKRKGRNLAALSNLVDSKISYDPEEGKINSDISKEKEVVQPKAETTEKDMDSTKESESEVKTENPAKPVNEPKAEEPENKEEPKEEPKGEVKPKKEPKAKAEDRVGGLAPKFDKAITNEKELPTSGKHGVIRCTAELDMHLETIVFLSKRAGITVPNKRILVEMGFKILVKQYKKELEAIGFDTKDVL